MIFAFVSQKGGVGKSTLAVAVSWELHAQRRNVLLVDADPQGTARVVGEVAAENQFAAPSIISLGKDMYRPDQLPRLSKGFDHVVIDTPGRLDNVQRAALMIADVAVVPVGQSAADTWGVSETLEAVHDAQILRPTLRAVLLVTRTLPRTTLGRNARDVLAASNIPLLRSETTFRVAWQESLAAGQGVAQYEPKGRAADEARGLVAELLEFSPRKGNARAKA